jgi:ribonuclease PH
VATRLALADLVRSGKSPRINVDDVLIGQIAAVSMGLKNGDVLTDLCYVEDSATDTDLNLVAYTDGRIVEVQGTAEGIPMKRDELDKMIDQGLAAIATLGKHQLEAVERGLA